MESVLPKHFAAIPVELEEHFKAEPENFKMFAYTGKLLDKFPLFLRESFKIPRFPDEPEEQSCSKPTREVLCELRECMSPAEATTAARELLNLIDCARACSVEFRGPADLRQERTECLRSLFRPTGEYLVYDFCQGAKSVGAVLRHPLPRRSTYA